MFVVQVTGLKQSQKYHYRVMAENAAGMSDPADKIGPVLADDIHGTLFHISPQYKYLLNRHIGYIL